jgi:hypothetical protein
VPGTAILLVFAASKQPLAIANDCTITTNRFMALLNVSYSETDRSCVKFNSHRQSSMTRQPGAGRERGECLWLFAEIEKRLSYGRA